MKKKQAVILGTIVLTILSVHGQTVRQSMAYDAWGALRNPSTGEAYAPDAQPELLLGRGYTGHEHLPEFGLVNMNARLYDPALGRFLNPDPEVQLPDITQSYNRYSYCLNNPLRYADPTGMFFDKDNQILYSKYLAQIQRQKDFYVSYVSQLDNEIARAGFYEKIAELSKSCNDLETLKNDPKIQYSFIDIEGVGYTEPITTNHIGIFTNGSLENIVHEVRHAAQISKRYYDFDITEDRFGHIIECQVNSQFNISYEVDAYKAQLATSFSGMIFEWSNHLIDEPVLLKVNEMRQITPRFIRGIIVDFDWLYKGL